MRLRTLTRIILTIISLLGTAMALDVYVAPGGDDQAAGTIDTPLQSLPEARDRLRAATDGADTNTVWLTDGLYRMDESLRLDDRDSGPVNGVNRWCAVPGATPVLSGSIIIDSWTLHDATNNIWMARVPTNLNTREIYIDGVRAVRARTNRGLSGTVTIDELGFLASDTSPLDWSNVPGLEINMLNIWQDPRVLVEAVSTTGAFTRITLQDRPTEILLTRTFNTGKNPQTLIQWIENDYTFIDQPQEWYLDLDPSTLFYKPADGVNPNDLEVSVPQLERLIQVEGRSVMTPVSNLELHGITFEETTFLRPSTHSYLVLRSHAFDESSADSGNNNYVLGSGAIEGKFVTDSTIHGCHFRRHGSNGVVLRQGSQRVTVQGCTFTDLGGGGILLGEPGEEDRNNVNPFDDRYLVRNVQVLDNFITRIGQIYRSANGIFAGFAVDALIARNELHDTPYSSISVGWGWAWEVDHAGRGNIVEQNAVFRPFGDGLSDGGSIYTHNCHPDSVVRRNYLHQHGAFHALLYPDIGSAKWLFEQNVMTQGVRWLFMHVALIEQNTFRQNYIDTNRSLLLGVNNTFEDNRLCRDGNWPAEALEIIQASGPAPAYRALVPLGVILVNPIPKAMLRIGESVAVVARPMGDPESFSHVNFQSEGIPIGSDFDGTDGWSIDWTPTIAGDRPLTATIHTLQTSETSEEALVHVLSAEQSRIYMQDTNGLICVEAEHYFRKNGPRNWTREWKPWNVWGGEVGTSMSVFPNEGFVGTGDGNEFAVVMDYAVEFIQTGPHRIYGRATSNGTANDTIHIAFDGQVIKEWVGAGQSGLLGWQWINQDHVGESVIVDVTRTGLHTITVILAEDALFLDRLVVKPVSADPPTDQGPPESASRPLGDVPVLSATATSQTGFEVPTIPGELTIWRESGLGPAVDISLSISGNATSGVDVVDLPGSVFLSETKGSVSIPVIPLDDGVADGGESVSIQLMPGEDFNYLLIYPSKVSIKIEDPEQAPTSNWRRKYWTSWYDPDAQDMADPDGDGWVNLLEEALGADPLNGILEEESVKPLKVWIEYEEGVPFLHLTHSRDIPAMETIDINVEGSPSLAPPDWQPLTPLNKRMEAYDFANGRLLHYIFSMDGSPGKYFRLRVQRR